MKTLKIIMPLTLVSATVIPACTITSCNKQSITESWEEYIFDRTFSILGADISGYVCWGTCWILSDATPTNFNDYVYNIVTNWHVMKGIESTGSNPYYFFGCNTKSSGLDISIGDFINFKSFVKYDDSNFTFNNVDTITTEEYDETTKSRLSKTGKRGCDIFVAKADFSSLAESTSSSASVAKQKLDKLNKVTASGSKITQLADTTTDTKHFENQKMYIGGYPVKNGEYATWERHDLSSEKISLVYNAGTQSTESKIMTHWSDSSNKPLTDCSPQYIGSDVGLTWMLGGASGSMLVGDFGTSNNPVYKVCGIYWGGIGDEETFFPCFSIFNSNWKNYLSQWE